MRNPMGKNIISLLFLSAFLFLRIGNTHALMHAAETSDTIDCELCEIITISNELTPVADQTPSDSDLTEIFTFDCNTPHFDYKAPLHCYVCPDVVHNKPPPTK